ncbi:prolipoprotein diacylglyceryl transferase [Candidatus Solincola tengchongensis]|uniref:prolipoprotein diacylglyceryl transferase n=1 Tax=Candidatus Solincola tengchongensis TaxID=2900693 RepID=UPI00257F2E49|nr:prolipoprotein diacylglyceryl transferase [Candidatus Solincola tengchongensis]
MRPELFKIGPLTVHSYGFFLALAFIVGMLVSFMYLRRKFLDAYVVFELVLAAAVGGIVGARLFYVLGHWREFSDRWWEAFKFWNVQGLVFYGGFILGILAAVAVVRLRGVSVGQVLDSGGLAVPAALAVARVGCYLNGCCFGKSSGLPWAVTFPLRTQMEMGMPRNPVHPTQIYELLMDLGIFVILLAVHRRFRYRGEIMLSFIMLYAVARFSNEFFRYHTQSGANLFFQALSAAAFLAAGLVLVFRRRLLAEDR